MDASINGVGESEIKAAGGFFAGIITAIGAWWVRRKSRPQNESPKDSLQALSMMVEIIREDRERESQERRETNESIRKMAESISEMAKNISQREQKTEVLHRDHASALLEQKKHLTIIEDNQGQHLRSLKVLTEIADRIARVLAEIKGGGNIGEARA